MTRNSKKSIRHPSKGKIRIGILYVDQDTEKRLRRMLGNLGDVTVVAKANNSVTLFELLRAIELDVVVMDIRAPELDRINLVSTAKELYPRLKLIGYHPGSPTEEDIIELSLSGAKSFIGNGDGPDELGRAIRIAHGGGIYLTNSVAATVQKHLMDWQHQTCPFLVTDFELNLLKNLSQGLSSTEIAAIICKSPRTVEKYREDLYRKFNVVSKEALISVAVRWNLV